jgi:glycosyltransferase involved in cell wall biosynthesis
MKIAQVSSLMEAVPPKLYGGTERIVAHLTNELVDLGHDVTLFASGDSRTRAKLVAAWPHALRLATDMRDYLAPHIILLEMLARRAADFDIIHLHIDYLSYPVLCRLNVPFVSTLHGRLDLPELQSVYETFCDVPVVSISDSQRRPMKSANFVDTIYHGLPHDLFHQGTGQGGYLAFIGRISPEKAPDAAIRIAQAAGMKIKIAAKIDKGDQAYFDERIKPLMSLPHVEFIGEVDEFQKIEFLGNAAALLFPIAWDEPFGLAMIEAMACGTPVIAIRRGSVSEVVDDGITGFIVETEAQAIAAVHRVLELDRSRVRQVFDEKFTARRMAEDYVRVYRRLTATVRQPAQLKLA